MEKVLRVEDGKYVGSDGSNSKTFKSVSLTLSSFPFTAPDDGFMQVTIRASAQGRVALYSGSIFCDGYQIAGGYIRSTSVISKGTVYPTPTLVNARTDDLGIEFITYE